MMATEHTEHDDTLTPEAIAAIKARADAATEGYWLVATNEERDSFAVMTMAHYETGRTVFAAGHEPTEADCWFTAHARTDIPALLRHIEALEQRIEALEAQNEKLVAHFNQFQELYAQVGIADIEAGRVEKVERGGD